MSFIVRNWPVALAAFAVFLLGSIYYWGFLRGDPDERALLTKVAVMTELVSGPPPRGDFDGLARGQKLAQNFVEEPHVLIPGSTYGAKSYSASREEIAPLYVSFAKESGKISISVSGVSVKLDADREKATMELTAVMEVERGPMAGKSKDVYVLNWLKLKEDWFIDSLTTKTHTPPQHAPYLKTP